jgi:hypothetical chaperone protein
MSLSLGLDFGTTNTVATLINARGEAEAIHFSHEGAAFGAVRSVLCFWQTEDARRRTVDVEAGPWAIDQFLALAGECRFIQSFKSFAASALFTDTLIYGQRMNFEALLTTYLRRLQRHAGQEFPKRVVIGRPVKFAGADPDDALARTRYEAALHDAGFEEIHHVYEPVAAAYFFAQRLTGDATILVADFGGGTSDFSIVRFIRRGNALGYEPLAHSGVGIAGDAFDYRILDETVAPAFGKHSQYQSWGKVLPMPQSYYSKFSRWNELSVMRHSRDYRELQQLARTSLEPDRIHAFLNFLDADAGYALNRAVSQAKLELSQADTGRLLFETPGARIDRVIGRREFDAWIAPELAEISACVDRALNQASLEEGHIDRVFLTGGTSFVPAVRAQFDRRFGAGKIETGDQLVSIAYGLSLIARQADVKAWSV